MSITAEELTAIVQKVIDKPLPASQPTMEDIVQEVMDRPLPAEDTSPVLIDHERTPDPDVITDHLPAEIVYEMYGRLSLYFFCRDRWFTRYQTALKYRRSINEPSIPIVRTYMTYQQAQILDLVR